MKKVRIMMDKTSGYTTANTFRQNNDNMVYNTESFWHIPVDNTEPVLKSDAKTALNKNNLLICRGLNCPYRVSCHNPCDMSAADLATNPPCPAELAVWVVQYTNYCEAFGVGNSDAVDKEQINELVNLEIKIMRCNKYIAINPKIIYETTENGIGVKKLNPIALYELKLLDQHSRILKALGAFG